MACSLQFFFRWLRVRKFWGSSSHNPPLDVLGASAYDCQVQLSAGKLTSVQLVDLYLEQIKKHDGYLRAVLELCPEAHRQAEALDKERRKGIIRGPLHGIPILLKDNINTAASLGMNTTGGSLAFIGSHPKKNAVIVDRTLDAGMIILGKAHLSEFAGVKGSNIFPGWSALGGQTQSAYTIDDIDFADMALGHSSPSGSSTGSAVAVSAGYCAVAIGTDTFGSLITPSTRAALYTLRPTMDLVDREGILPVSPLFDTAGPMAKSVSDLANLLDALISPEHIRGIGSYAESLAQSPVGGFEEIRVGVLSPQVWFFGPELQREVSSATAQIISDTNRAYAKIKGLAKSFQHVTLISPDQLVIDGRNSFFDSIAAGFKESIETYIKTLETPSVRTLEEIIQFNKDHADVELPPNYDNQDQLVRAFNINMSSERRNELLKHARKISRDLGIDKTLKDYDIDVIIAPADSPFNLLVSAAGYPSATMPLSYLDYNGRPIGLAVFSTAHTEKLLLKVMKAWEKISPPRRLPQSLHH